VDFSLYFSLFWSEMSSLVTGSSATQSGYFSLSVVFGKKHPFCGPNGPNVIQISALGFFVPRDVTPIGPLFSATVNEVPFAGEQGPSVRLRDQVVLPVYVAHKAKRPWLLPQNSTS
jgi:hypothetical protein